jgi:hypothetical protein
MSGEEKKEDGSEKPVYHIESYSMVKAAKNIEELEKVCIEIREDVKEMVNLHSVLIQKYEEAGAKYEKFFEALNATGDRFVAPEIHNEDKLP